MSTLQIKKDNITNILNRISTVSIPKKKNIEKVEKPKVQINENLKSPICSFLGHVDAGKTSLMDIIRGTNLQSKEAGGITQSIGSSFVPIENIMDMTKQIRGKFSVKPEIPGMLIIDTPGHAAFNILRERGSSLCDIAILVIDIIDGVKPQTIESIKLLQERKVPFVIAATKLDLIDDYKTTKETSLRKAFKKQTKDFMYTVQYYMDNIKDELKEHNIKSEFYFKNKKPKNIYSIVPISSKTKEGLSDLLALLVFISQNWMNKKIAYNDKVDATIMECIQDKRMGWVLDIILKNGTINIGDKFAVSSKNGEKIVTVRKLLIQCSNTFQEKSSVRASCGVRILGSNCDNCYSGTKLYPIEESSDLALEKAHQNISSFWSKFVLSDIGVNLQASTFGELDAMYQIFNQENIPIMNLQLKNFQDKDILRVQTRIENIKDKEYRCLLYFGNITPKEMDNYNKLSKAKGPHSEVKIFNSKVIYDLLEQYKKYKTECLEERQKNQIKSGDAIYPCKLKILKKFIFMKGGADDLMFGVRVKEGRLRIGSPLFIKDIKKNKNYELGKVISMQKNNEDIEIANCDDEICIRIDNPDYLYYGRHFDNRHEIISRLTRDSIEILKKDYRNEMFKEDWLLVIELMKILGIERKNKN